MTELQVALSKIYEERFGKSIYELALEEHREDPRRPPPRDPNEQKGTKHYNITVKVRIEDPDESLADYRSRVEEIFLAIEPILERSYETVRGLEERGEDATEQTEEWNRWIALSRKFNDSSDYSDGEYRTSFELKGVDGPPVEEVLEEAIQSAIRRYSTNPQENQMLESIGFYGFKLDRSRIKAEVSAIENLSALWLRQEEELVRKLEGIED